MIASDLSLVKSNNDIKVGENQLVGESLAGEGDSEVIKISKKWSGLSKKKKKDQP